MTKQQFLTAYLKLDARDRAYLTEHYMCVYKNAIFPETMAEAEQRLAWIREIGV